MRRPCSPGHLLRLLGDGQEHVVQAGAVGGHSVRGGARGLLPFSTLLVSSSLAHSRHPAHSRAVQSHFRLFTRRILLWSYLPYSFPPLHTPKAAACPTSPPSAPNAPNWNNPSRHDNANLVPITRNSPTTSAL